LRFRLLETLVGILELGVDEVVEREDVDQGLVPSYRWKVVIGNAFSWAYTKSNKERNWDFYLPVIGEKHGLVRETPQTIPN
jgi:hypothetical protein